MSLDVSEITWLRNLLKLLELQQQVTPLLLCDNVSHVFLSANLMFHKKTKHYNVEYHYIHDRVNLKALQIKLISAFLKPVVSLLIFFLNNHLKLQEKNGISLPPIPNLKGHINKRKLKSSAPNFNLNGSQNKACYQMLNPTSDSNLHPSLLSYAHDKCVQCYTYDYNDSNFSSLYDHNELYCRRSCAKVY